MAVVTNIFEAMTASRIDRDNGIIYGVSVITEGQAKGYDTIVDSTTLEQVSKVGNASQSGVKVKLRHKMQGEYQSVLESVVGFIKNFTVTGKKVIGDLHVLKSFKSDLREKLFEMAETMPDEFGLSIHCTGDNEERGEQKFVRCNDLASVDLTEAPAANPSGLFEESKTMSKEKEGKHEESCECKECNMERRQKKLEEGLTKLTETITALAPKVTSTNVFTVKTADGKEQTLSAQDIFTQLEAAASATKAAAAVAEATLRKEAISKIVSQGRVVKNPATGIAYKLEELETLSLDTLKFAAVNAPAVPLEAKALYKGKETQGSKTVDPNLKGSQLVVAMLEEQGFTSVEAMNQMGR